MTDNIAHHRSIRSFVRRQGRMSQAQQRALTCLWSRYGIEFKADAPLNCQAVFNTSKPLVCEIGFGMGDSLWQQAKAHPEQHFLGIEVHQPGVGALLSALDKHDIDNVRIISHDAVAVMQAIPDASVDRIQIFFPDPWPKKRHHKRRLIQPEFAELLAQKLSPNGHLHLATDWRDYAEHMLTVLNTIKSLANTSPTNTYSPRPAYRPSSKFERRGVNLGHGIYDLVFSRI